MTTVNPVSFYNPKAAVAEAAEMYGYLYCSTTYNSKRLTANVAVTYKTVLKNGKYVWGTISVPTPFFDKGGVTGAKVSKTGKIIDGGSGYATTLTITTPDGKKVSSTEYAYLNQSTGSISIY